MAKSDILRQESGEDGVRHGLEAGAHDSATYRITVRGCLDTSWSEWFDGLAVSPDCDLGETTLAGPVADQAALHGLLNKVRNLGLTLLWVHRVDPREAGSARADAGPSSDPTH